MSRKNNTKKWLNVSFVKTANDAGSSAASAEAVECQGGAILATLTPGMRALCVHTPTADGVPHLITLAANGNIYIFSGEGFKTRTLIGTRDEETFGSLTATLCHADIVTLAGSTRPLWLIFDHTTECYSLCTTLPPAPDCSLSLTSTTLLPYTQAGDEETVLLAANLYIGEDRAALSPMNAWLTGEDGRGVDASIKEEVYAAVAESVEQYLLAVEAAGMVTSPMRGFAALNGRLAGQIMTAGNYRQPSLLLESWTYIDGMLRLNLRLSAPPCRPGAIVSITEDHARWSDVFSRMEIYLGSPVKWWQPSAGTGVTITGLVNILVNGQRRRGFAMYALADSEYAAALAGQYQFKAAGSVSTAQAMEGVMQLRRDESAHTIMPDYTDHDRLSADGGVATTDGPVLFSGETILTSDKDFPVLFPSRKRICDSHIRALSESFRSRSATDAGRTPLLAFCDDGIRLVSSDGKGGYGPAQFLTGDIVADAGSVTLTTDSVVFLTLHGLVKLSGTKRSVILDIGDMEGLHSGSIWYSYLHNFLVLGDNDGINVFDIESGLTGECDHKITEILEYDGRLYGRDVHGHLLELRLTRHKSTSEDGSVTTVLSTILLPFTDPWTSKRIYAVDFGKKETEWALEATDEIPPAENQSERTSADDIEWISVATGITGESGMSGRLRLPSFRNWRLSVRSADNVSITGARILYAQIN